MSNDAPQVVAITGAAGRIGRAVAPFLRNPGRELRLLDRAVPADRDERDRWFTGDITEPGALDDAFRGADLVVHLAAHPWERPWPEILAVNIDGTQKVLDAAHEAGVPRVLLASSIHAVGYATPDEAGADDVLVPRPDTFYGVSKAAGEALGSVYADRFGMTVVSARICAFNTEVGEGRALAQWLSPADAARLVEAAAALDRPGHHIVWGVSDNAPGWFPLGPGHAIGFHPQDDAVRHVRERDGVEPPQPDREGALAGIFADDEHPLGGEWS
ncbi:NAD-dependent epimerase/dehydratase family protein [Promicromonospora sukumoe]|uniref:NAD-dependent epimerase/dehydratase family protein n=1 Tax=Promicromonospora sukumoe TaxID=88382 RepID=UPI0037CA8470